jgi:acetyl-CoA synthetase
VIEQVRRAWGLTVRDGYGQTETTAQIGNTPGALVKDGSMGRALPGYRIALLAPDGAEGDEGEIALPLADRPLGLMNGYRDDEELSATATRDGYYHTAISPRATATATSPTWVVRTTCSEPPTTGSRRSSSRAC